MLLMLVTLEVALCTMIMTSNPVPAILQVMRANEGVPGVSQTLDRRLHVWNSEHNFGDLGFIILVVYPPRLTRSHCPEE